eukprot:2353130-Ditylum_brightwellii.AAC.1
MAACISNEVQMKKGSDIKKAESSIKLTSATQGTILSRTQTRHFVTVPSLPYTSLLDAPSSFGSLRAYPETTMDVSVTHLFPTSSSVTSLSSHLVALHFAVLLCVFGEEDKHTLSTSYN